MMFPKPSRPERRTKAAREYLAKVAQLPCLICGMRPVHCHHAIHGRHSQTKASDFDTLPLCPGCHDDLHRNRLAWIAAHGPDIDLVPRVRAMVAALEMNSV